VEGQRPGQLWDYILMGVEKGGTTGWHCQNGQRLMEGHISSQVADRR